MSKSTKKTVEDPRKAMLRVRADVKAYVTGAAQDLDHLGQYPKNMPDAKRTIIALQDLLDEEKTKHKKATEHVMRHREMIMGVSAMSQMVVGHSTEQIREASQVIGELTKQRDGMTDECTRLSEGWREANVEIFQLRSKLAAAMTTLKAVMDDEDVHSVQMSVGN